nr:MAG TPA: hypothetical protein [Caudoviricetes sp.]
MIILIAGRFTKEVLEVVKVISSLKRLLLKR